MPPPHDSHHDPTQGHTHQHTHGHHHHTPGHSHAPARFGPAFAIGVTANLLFLIAEIIASIPAHSVALLGDAGHNLGDFLGLVMAWVAATMARRGPSARYTYGFGRGTILAALLNGTLMLASCGAILAESARRLLEPQASHPIIVAIVAGIGIAVNGGTALMFAAGRANDLNREGVFQHMAADAAVSAGVVLAALLIWRTGWQWLDPAVSLLLAILIAISAWRLLRASLSLSFDAVPGHIDLPAVTAFLAALPGVTRLHDLHVWPMSTTRTALTCHLVMIAAPDGFAVLLSRRLHEQFGIDHTTLQIECEDEACSQAAGHVAGP